MARVLCIADKHIKDEAHWQNNPKAHQNMKQKICSVGGRQGITLPEGNKVYTLIRMHCCDPVCVFLFGMPIFCKPVG
jgi:hypothetical protein